MPSAARSGSSPPPGARTGCSPSRNCDLEDPKGSLGGLESVNKLVRKGFYQEQPEAYEFLGRMVLPLADVEAIMFEAQNSSYEKAVDNYIAKNPDRIEYWVTGQMKAG